MTRPEESLGRDGCGFHVFNKYLLRAILEAGDTSVSKTSINPCPHGAFVLLRGHSQ